MFLPICLPVGPTPVDCWSVYGCRRLEERDQDVVALDDAVGVAEGELEGGVVALVPTQEGRQVITGRFRLLQGQGQHLNRPGRLMHKFSNSNVVSFYTNMYLNFFRLNNECAF